MTLPFTLGRFTLSRRAWMLVAVLVPLLLVFAWVAFRSGPLAPVRVTAVTVEERAIAPALFGIGTVEARYTHRIGPTAPGRVRRVWFSISTRPAVVRKIEPSTKTTVKPRTKRSAPRTTRLRER